MRKVVPLSPACQVVSGPFEPVAFDVDGYQGDFPDNQERGKNDLRSLIWLHMQRRVLVCIAVKNRK